VASFKWYVINTKPRREDLVFMLLRNHGFEAFLPKINSRKKDKDLEPLFPGYLFVKLDLTDPKWIKVKYLPGVRRVVSYGNQPAVLSDKIVSLIKDRLKRNDYQSKKLLKLKKGDRVRFITGPFCDLEGIFTGELAGRDRVRILLNTLYLSLKVEVEADKVERVS
jgi:transcriptional antiterminator RfaH